MSEKNEKNKKKYLSRLIVIAIIAIIFVPLLYSGIYLYAFWDPYGRLNNVPIAFVNLDKLVIKDGKEYNLGKDIEENLKENTKMGWKFVSYDDAKKGVSGTEYYALIVIPEDFSETISESTSGKSIKPTILYEANKGKNFVFAQVSEKSAESIREEVASSIQEETTKALAGGLYDVKDSLLDASEGANELQSGIEKLSDGSKQLLLGLTTATDGSKQLYDGLKDAAYGEEQLSNGIDTLVSGLNEFKSGFTQNTESISKLATGSKSLSDGMSALASGTEKANLSQGLTTAADGISQIKSTLNQVSSILVSSSEQASIDSAKTIINQLVESINNQKIEDTLRVSANNAGDLVGNLNKLSNSTKQISEGTSNLVNSLKTTQNTAVDGVDKLINGANTLKSGSNDILNGLNTATEKTGELSSGLGELNIGASNLSNGIDSINEGSLKLKDGLSNGYDTMDSTIKFDIEDISSFMANPLTLSDVSINPVKYYGEGLAPYFISLSLWVGAMLINIIVTLVNLLKVVQNKFLKTYTGTFLGGCVLTMLQAIILTFGLINGLRLTTPHNFLFYIENMFISVVFFSVMYGISYAFGLVGTGINFILLVLQLASSAGTFPIETAPMLNRIIYPLIPMTYTVEGLRMVISGINSERFIKISSILVLFMLAFYIGGYLFKRAFKGLRSIKTGAQ